ncbi:unnamed protein product [Phyllotreta striolata]|uniref:Sodium/calcium exchanger membrane region domain-containing protein n=1 Tax=Phyllotreta striolata TaxID=444603 RepID=A0A9N9TT24_PHYSR|nr:unnamed protein product [Phyllotreta striolata]
MMQSVLEINCTPPAVDEFPVELFSTQQLVNGAIVVPVLLTVYSFIAIAIVCDEYFVPVVEKICTDLNVPSDIGGATFMAIATAAPELFINIVGTFVTKGDIGLGTIVGSAVFNNLAVTACCGLTLAIIGAEIQLERWSITRDSLVYGVSACLLIVFLNNEKIEWFEAMILVLLYIAYIVFLVFDKKIQTLVKRKHPSEESGKQEDAPKVEDGDEESNDNETTSVWKFPSKSNCFSQGAWVINWPINFAFFVTIPSGEKLKSKVWISLAFLMCIIWIGILSYVLSWMITIIGDTLRIPDSVMGITFLAIGAGVPEAASSIAVVKHGNGAMGISNSLGSNTLDILLCLGLPWLLKSSLASDNKWVNINSSGLQYSAFSLLVTLVAFYLAIWVNKFKLNKWVGLYTLIVYLIFIVFASLIELNVFFEVNLPTCRK